MSTLSGSGVGSNDGILPSSTAPSSSATTNASNSMPAQPEIPPNSTVPTSSDAPLPDVSDNSRQPPGTQEQIPVPPGASSTSQNLSSIPVNIPQTAPTVNVQDLLSQLQQLQQPSAPVSGLTVEQQRQFDMLQAQQQQQTQLIMQLLQQQQSQQVVQEQQRQQLLQQQQQQQQQVAAVATSPPAGAFTATNPPLITSLAANYNPYASYTQSAPGQVPIGPSAVATSALEREALEQLKRLTHELQVELGRKERRIRELEDTGNRNRLQQQVQSYLEQLRSQQKLLDRYKGQESQLQALQRDVQQLTDNLAATNDTLKGEREAWARKEQLLVEKLDEQEAEVGVLEERLVAHIDSVRELRAEIQLKDNTVTQLEATVAAQRVELDQLRTQQGVSQLTRERDDAYALLRESESARARVEDELAAATEQRREAEREAQALRRELIGERELKTREVMGEMQQVVQENKRLRTDNRELRERWEVLVRQVEESEGEMLVIRQQVHALEDGAGAATDREMRVALRKRDVQISDLKVRLGLLERAVARYRSRCASLAAQAGVPVDGADSAEGDEEVVLEQDAAVAKLRTEVLQAERHIDRLERERVELLAELRDKPVPLGEGVFEGLEREQRAKVNAFINAVREGVDLACVCGAENLLKQARRQCEDYKRHCGEVLREKERLEAEAREREAAHERRLKDVLELCAAAPPSARAHAPGDSNSAGARPSGSNSGVAATQSVEAVPGAQKAREMPREGGVPGAAEPWHVDANSADAATLAHRLSHSLRQLVAREEQLTIATQYLRDAESRVVTLAAQHQLLLERRANERAEAAAKEVEAAAAHDRLHQQHNHVLALLRSHGVAVPADMLRETDPAASATLSALDTMEPKQLRQTCALHLLESQRLGRRATVLEAQAKRYLRAYVLLSGRLCAAERDHRMSAAEKDARLARLASAASHLAAKVASSVPSALYQQAVANARRATHALDKVMVTLPPLQLPVTAEAVASAEELREEPDVAVLRIKATQVCRERDALRETAAMFEQEVQQSRAREEALRKDYVAVQKTLLQQVSTPSAAHGEELRALAEAVEQAQAERDEYRRKCVIQAEYARAMQHLYALPAPGQDAEAAAGSAGAMYRELERVRAAAVEVGGQSDEAAAQVSAALMQLARADEDLLRAAATIAETRALDEERRACVDAYTDIERKLASVLAALREHSAVTERLHAASDVELVSRMYAEAEQHEQEREALRRQREECLREQDKCVLECVRLRAELAELREWRVRGGTDYERDAAARVIAATCDKEEAAHLAEVRKRERDDALQERDRERARARDARREAVRLRGVLQEAEEQRARANQAAAVREEVQQLVGSGDVRKPSAARGKPNGTALALLGGRVSDDEEDGAEELPVIESEPVTPHTRYGSAGAAAGKTDNKVLSDALRKLRDDMAQARELLREQDEYITKLQGEVEALQAEKHRTALLKTADDALDVTHAKQLLAAAQAEVASLQKQLRGKESLIDTLKMQSEHDQRRHQAARASLEAELERLKDLVLKSGSDREKVLTVVSTGMCSCREEIEAMMTERDKALEALNRELTEREEARATALERVRTLEQDLRRAQLAVEERERKYADVRRRYELEREENRARERELLQRADVAVGQMSGAADNAEGKDNPETEEDKEKGEAEAAGDAMKATGSAVSDAEVGKLKLCILELRDLLRAREQRVKALETAVRDMKQRVKAVIGGSAANAPSAQQELERLRAVVRELTNGADPATVVPAATSEADEAAKAALEQSVSTLTNTVKAQKVKLDKLRAALEKERQLLEEKTAAAAEKETELRSECDKLRRERERAQALCTKERDKAQKLEQRLSAMQAKQGSAAGASSDGKVTASVIPGSAAEAEDRRERREAESAVSRELAQLRRAQATLKQRHAELKQRHVKLLGEHTQTKSELSAATTALHTLSKSKDTRAVAVDPAVALARVPERASVFALEEEVAALKRAINVDCKHAIQTLHDTNVRLRARVVELERELSLASQCPLHRADSGATAAEPAQGLAAGKQGDCACICVLRDLLRAERERGDALETAVMTEKEKSLEYEYRLSTHVEESQRWRRRVDELEEAVAAYQARRNNSNSGNGGDARGGEGEGTVDAEVAARLQRVVSELAEVKRERDALRTAQQKVEHYVRELATLEARLDAAVEAEKRERGEKEKEREERRRVLRQLQELRAERDRDHERAMEQVAGAAMQEGELRRDAERERAMREKLEVEVKLHRKRAVEAEEQARQLGERAKAKEQEVEELKREISLFDTNVLDQVIEVKNRYEQSLLALHKAQELLKKYNLVE